eukprot:COSAG06_NODE_48168_length_334_cov_0.659574_2_plen_24_part_01
MLVLASEIVFRRANLHLVQRAAVD